MALTLSEADLADVNKTTLGKTSSTAQNRPWTAPLPPGKLPTRAPLRFDEQGQNTAPEPTPVRDWVNENVLRPAVGGAAAMIGGSDPAAIFSQGATSTARLLDPVYDYVQAWKQRLGYDYDPNMHAVSEGFQGLQKDSPQWLLLLRY